MKPIKTAFGREIIFGGEGEIGKLNRDQNTRVGVYIAAGSQGAAESSFMERNLWWISHRMYPKKS